MTLVQSEGIDNIVPFLDHVGNETSESLSIEFPVTTPSKDEVRSFLEFVESLSDTVLSMSVEAEYSDSRPPTGLIRMGRNSLEVPNLSRSPDWFSHYRKEASYYLDESEYSDLVDTILNIAVSEVSEVIVTAQIKKENFERSISENLDKVLENNKVQASIWTSADSLQKWVHSMEAVDVIERLFDSRRSPLFVFLGKEDTVLSSSGLLSISYAQLDEFDWTDLDSKYQRFNETQAKAEELFRFTGLDNSISPALFEANKHQQIFRPVLLYGLLGTIPEEARYLDGHIKIRIEGNMHSLEEDIQISQLDFTEGEISDFYRFYTEFSDKADREVYRRLWHQAIIEYCEYFDELPEYQDKILDYYESLEQNAIEGNFEELSGAVQDAQIFIGDVTNTLSSRTVELTTEIQKIVLALFGIITANVFLLIQEAALDVAIPFTTAFTAALLLFYFPTAQERVDEISDVIREGKNDAEVYSSLAEGVGADQLVDLSEFRERQNAYIDLAESRRDWANKRLRQGFLLFNVVWILTGVYGVITLPISSSRSLVILSTIGAAIWILRNQTNYNYNRSMSRFGLRAPQIVICSIGIAYLFNLIITFY